ASRIGSYLRTMPGPPPYGRSSTVLWRSLVKSRGDTCSIASSPRSRALPTTPCRATGSTSSGNSATMPTVYTSSVPEARLPVDDDDAPLEVDVDDDVALDEGNHPPFLPAQHDHVVRPGRHQ